MSDALPGQDFFVPNSISLTFNSLRSSTGRVHEESHFRHSIDNSSGFQSCFTDSTGRQSQIGATWKQSLTLTMNSGFASGAPRSEGWKGVREGREKGGFLPRLKGVGRTGKPPAPVPRSMLEALGVKVDGNGREEKDKGNKWTQVAQRFGRSGTRLLPWQRAPEETLMETLTRSPTKYDVERVKACWAKFDITGTGYISTEEFPWLLREMRGQFDVGLYDNQDSLRTILGDLNRNLWLDPLYGPIEFGLPELNARIAQIDSQRLLERRYRHSDFYNEVVFSTDIYNRISLNDLVEILALHQIIGVSDDIGDLLRTPEWLERRRIRLERVREEMDKRIVLGFFDTLFYRRKFLRHMELKGMEQPSGDGVPLLTPIGELGPDEREDEIPGPRVTSVLMPIGELGGDEREDEIPGPRVTSVPHPVHQWMAEDGFKDLEAYREELEERLRAVKELEISARITPHHEAGGAAVDKTSIEEGN